MSAGSELSALDARVLRATDARYERSPEKIGLLAGCAADVALSTLRRLRVAYLVEDDGERPRCWLRTHRGDVALEHTPGAAPVGAPWRSGRADDRVSRSRILLRGSVGVRGAGQGAAKNGGA